LAPAVKSFVVKKPSGEPAFQSDAITDDIPRLGFGVRIQPARLQPGVVDQLADFR